MSNYNHLGLPLTKALDIAGMTRHAYYYKPVAERKQVGRQPSTHTVRRQLDLQGKLVETIYTNSEVLDLIKTRCTDPDLHHGYHSMADHLQNEGFDINHKKVYRLMKAEQLLHEPIRPTSNKQRVRHRRFEVNGPLEGLEMDIKFVFVEEYRRKALVLSVIDVFTRELLGWRIAYSIKGRCVQQLWEELIVKHLQAADTLRHGINVQIRNDNDPRFSAQAVQDFFKQNYLGQVFTHPYTPQENGHIESFHSILARSVIDRSFATLEHLDNYIGEFYTKYNQRRVHGSTAGLPPTVFKQQWEAGNISVEEDARGKQKFRLKVPRYTLAPRLRPSGKMNQKPVVAKKSDDGPDNHRRPSVQKSPSASCC